MSDPKPVYRVERGNPMAVAVTMGILLIGGCFCLIGVGGSILFPAIEAMRYAGDRSASMANVKQLARGIILYSTDNDDRLVLKENWCDALLDGFVTTKSAFGSPMMQKEDKSERYDFALWAELSGKKFAEIPNQDTQPLLFESAQNKKNQFGNYSLIPRPSRYKDTQGNEMLPIALLNGNARMMKYEELGRENK